MTRYDYVFAGGGAAALSLACRLAASPLRDRSMLIVDRLPEPCADRTFCFWTAGPTLFDAAVSHAWDRLLVAGPEGLVERPTAPYRYAMIAGADFARLARARLASAAPNVTFRTGMVTHIADGPDAAVVTVEGEPVSATWVFDSRPVPAPMAPDTVHYLHLRQVFWGWTIETPAPAFDPARPTFLDFRTPQGDEMRFLYVLPLSPTRALGEFVANGAAVLRRDDCAAALDAYLRDVLHLPAYTVVAEEHGITPLTDQPFPRRAGRRVLNIGLRGGRGKPTTGYAFARIQADAAAVARSLLRAGHPFALPPDSRRYRLYDRVLLQILATEGERLDPIFLQMFQRNPLPRVLRFLDEAGTPADDLALIRTLPPRHFLEAGFHLTVVHPLLDAGRRLTGKALS